MKTSGSSYSMTANHFGILDIGTIENWNTKFLKDGNINMKNELKH